MAAPSIVPGQVISGAGYCTGGSTAPLGTNFPSNTTAGNYLLGFLSYQTDPGAITMTPSGYSLVGKFNNGTGCYLVIYEYVNAPQQTGIQDFTVTLAAADAWCFIEIQNASTTSPRDGSPATASGTSSSPATGSLATSNANELILCPMAQTVGGINATYTFSAPTGNAGAAILVQQSGNHIVSTPRSTAGLCIVDYTVSSTGSYSGGCTSSRSDSWVGITLGIQGPAAAALLDDDEPPTQRLRGTSVSSGWSPGGYQSVQLWQTEELPLALVAALEDEGAAVLTAPAARGWGGGVAAADEALGFLPVEQEDHQAPARMDRAWTGRAFTDDEAVGFPLVEQEDWQPPRQMEQPWTSRVFTDDEVTGAGLHHFALEQEEHYSFQARTTDRPWAPRVFADDETAAGLLTPIVEEETWQPPQFMARPWVSVVFLDEDPAPPPLVDFALDQEEGWQPPQVMVVPWTPAVFADEDPAPPPQVFFYLDQEEAWAAQVMATPWTPTVFADDEIAGTLAVAPLDQEDAWTAQVTTREWTPRVFTDDEVTGAGLLRFGLEEEYQYVDRRTAVVWTGRVFLTDEDGAGLYPIMIVGPKFTLTDPGTVIRTTDPGVTFFANDPGTFVRTTDPGVAFSIVDPGTTIQIPVE